jgi:signal transduction histidine kinase/CheY-like chemotaxis protein
MKNAGASTYKKKQKASSLKALKNDFIKTEPKNPVFKLLKTSDKISPDLKITEIYKKAFLASNTGFWLFNPKKNTIWLSDEFIELVQLKTNKNAINVDNLKKIVTEDKLNLYEKITQLSGRSKPTETELKFTDDKSMGQQVLLCRIVVLKNKKRNSNLVLGIAFDITGQKNFEVQLAKAKEKAEESDRIKTTFLSNISHEIRTPMNAIIGFNELIHIGDLSSNRKKEYLTIVKNKSKHLLSLLDDITELSKFETGEITLNHTCTNLVKIFNELYEEFKKELKIRKKQNVELYLKLPATNEIASVFTDPGRIYQVMAYLLDNALKFTEKGYVQFGYEPKDSRNIQFFVKDTGIGITKEAQKYLFNRFKIKEEAYSTKHRNTGLGLTISRAIVELLGGKISVSSESGKGSTFSFTVPFQKIEKNLLEENLVKYEPRTKWGDKVILIAEDDEVNFRFLEAILADTQVQLLHVRDGKQAIDLCKTIGKIDLILMDIKMPEKSGYEAIKEIKKYRKDVPIIAQTAYTLKEDKAKCIDAGCDDYISKPIDIELLLGKIAKYFNE